MEMDECHCGSGCCGSVSRNSIGRTNEEIELGMLAMQYHARCNAFDDIVCTARSIRSGEAMPANGRELGVIGRNARLVRDDVTRQGAEMGYTERQVWQAIQQHARDSER